MGDPQLGKIISGAPADFMIVRGDPTISIENFKSSSIRAVVTQGNLIWQTQLETATKNFIEYLSRPIVKVLLNCVERIPILSYLLDVLGILW